MNTTQRGILALIKSAVTQAPQPLPEGFDLEMAYPLIRRHQIPTLAFDGALLCGIPGSHPVMRQLMRSYCKALAVTEGQIRETEKLLEAFEGAGIHYMPLKGYNMRPRYPKKELRLMGDTDLLIRMEQYGRIVPIMEELGYVCETESDHELIWKKSSMYMELHKRVVPSYDKDLHAYFGSGWDFDAGQEGFRHYMTAEDEFVYLFAHFAKHYRGGGIGCRHVTDLWVFLRSHPGLKEEQVLAKLQTLGLTEFYANMRRLLEVWFRDGQPDGKTGAMTDYLFGSGTWGEKDVRMLADNLRSTGGRTFANRAVYLWNLVFPNFLAMKGQYPVLRKWPVLLPVMYLWRPVDKLFIRRKSLKVHRENLSVLTSGKLGSHREHLRHVGLKFR